VSLPINHSQFASKPISILQQCFGVSDYLAGNESTLQYLPQHLSRISPKYNATNSKYVDSWNLAERRDEEDDKLNVA